MKKDILENRIYLYVTEFFAGMGVMAVELGASRLLAPYFSSSQIVWTIIIGTIMIAMALGNIYGGRSADKDPSPEILYRRLLIASVWIAAIPVLGKYIIILISGLLVFTISTNFLIIAAFIACMVIFVFPLFLLGTVTPSLAKYTLQRMTNRDNNDDSGKVVGQLGAANTIGSIIGTFMPTFITIPAVGTAVTFLIFSGIILAIGLIFFISRRSHIKLCVISAVLFVFCAIFGNSDSFAFWQPDLTYEGESIYNYLQVAEDDRSVRLSTNVLFGVQSITMKSDELTGMYYDYALAAPLIAGARLKNGENADMEDFSESYTEKAEKNGTEKMGEDKTDILILGMGTGTFARQCDKYYNNISIEGVEIDNKITELSYKYFDASPEIPVFTYDGRAYLQTVKDQYDVIMVDAYQDISIPFQMSSAEFFREVYDHLNENGVMVVNMNMHSDMEGNINEYLSDTIASVFPSVAIVDVPGYTNRELFAVKSDGASLSGDYISSASEEISDVESVDSVKNVKTVGSGDILARFDAALDNITVKDELYQLMVNIRAVTNVYKGGEHIFTDDKAPVELLGMREIDQMISEELTYYKSVYKERGLQGVMDMIL
ncbi:MAG: fused MFS/spermidine synthase [Lachnospiraceae bacterium]|nr:fused MFS/spermidine synthase [Lachnospiraceae bacterium]